LAVNRGKRSALSGLGGLARRIKPTTLLKEVKMQKLLSIVIAAMFASVSFTSFAASHAGAQKMEKKEEMKKDAKKDAKKEMKKEEKKEEKKK
jgi:hypothetical protein